MYRHIAITIFFTVLSVCNYAQGPSISFSQLDSLQKQDPRKVIVFIHTGWCRYCRAMEETTFKKSAVKKILSSEFYFVSLNAEEKQDIFFNRRVYKFKPTGRGTGMHELAEQLGTIKGNVTYPVICILNEKNEIIGQQADYINAHDFKNILQVLK